MLRKANRKPNTTQTAAALRASAEAFEQAATSQEITAAATRTAITNLQAIVDAADVAVPQLREAARALREQAALLG